MSKEFLSGPFEQRDKLVTIYIYKNKLQLQTNNVLVTKALFPNTEKGPYHNGVGGWGYKG